MDEVTRRKWDRAAANFDLMASRGPEKRWAPFKREFFSRMGEGRILFLAVGTGLDFPFFPSGRDIVGIDISQLLRPDMRPPTTAVSICTRCQRRPERFRGSRTLLSFNSGSRALRNPAIRRIRF